MQRVKSSKLMLTALLTLNLEFVKGIADPPMPQTSNLNNIFLLMCHNVFLVTWLVLQHEMDDSVSCKRVKNVFLIKGHGILVANYDIRNLSSTSS